MARKPDPLSDSFETDDADGWLGGIVADEDNFDRQTLWGLGLWGVAAVGALTLSLMAGQLPVHAQRTQLAPSDLGDRAGQVEATIQEGRLEARRLAAAIETLNADRDRLFQRLSTLEQGLDLVTGSIRNTEDRPKAAPWPNMAVAPVVESAPATITLPAPAPAPPLMAPVAATAPPAEAERAATMVAARTEPPPAEIPSSLPTPAPSAILALPIPDPQPAAPEADGRPAEDAPVAWAEFGVDLGAANSLNGLRALWRGLARTHGPQLEGLRPLLAVRERNNGLGLQLRLIAGPIKDAAAAARICAALSEAARNCRTTAFDGQRLTLAAEPAETVNPLGKRRSTRTPPASATADPRAAEASSLSTLLGYR
jgi:hypothetical protein